MRIKEEDRPMKDMQSTGPGKKRGLWMIGVAALTGAVLFTWFLLVRADRQLRTDLLQQTQLVAQALNLDRIRALTATEADLTNPHYKNLKERLVAVRAVNPDCRFVYLMGRRVDGAVFFFADSEPPDSEDYSPPGQVYEDATESDHHVFDARVAAVEGPYSDSWGLWVSALVPVIDPQTNDLLAVIGMDIDARDWKWNVAEKTALPAGLMLVLLIVVFASRIAARRINASPRPVLSRLLLPLAGMMVFLTVGSGVLLWQQHQDRITRDVAIFIDETSRNLQAAMDQHASAMLQTLKTVAANSGKALREGDADRLLADWRPVFDRMHRENNLTHFYFLDANRACLLRVHNPEKRGSLIDRFTALEAERTGEAVSGIELGNQDTLTLRTVQPVFDNNRLAGYVELGKEISNVLESMSLRPNVQLALLVHKEHLNRRTFEEGMHRLGKTVDWDFLPHSVVIHASQGSLPDAFAPVADHDPAAEHAHNQIDREVIFDGKNWRVSATSLKDASGKEIGCLLIMFDITPPKQAFIRLTILGGTAAAVLLALLLGIIYVLLRRTDAGIRAQQKELRENEERLSATLRSIGDGVITCGIQGDTVSLNAVAEILTGWSSDEAQGRPVSEIFRIVHAETRQKVENPVVRTLSEDVVVDLANHTVLIGRDGREYHIADSCAPIHSAAGSVIGAVLVFRDVSEAYRRREQDRFELRFQQTVTELSAQFVNITENEFDEAVNQVLARLGMLFEVDRSYLFSLSEDLSAMNNTHEWCASGIVPQKDRIQNFPVNTMPWWKRRIQDMKPLHIPEVEALPPEAEAEKKEFQIQNIRSLICLPIRNDRGRLMGFLGFDAVYGPHAWPEHQIHMLQVVAEIIGGAINRNAAQRRLHESEEKHRLLIENSREIIYTLTPDGVFSFVSPASMLMMGYPPGQIVGRNFRNFIHPEDISKCEAFLLRAVESQQPQESAEYRIRHMYGTWRWHTTSMVSLRDESGAVTGFQGTSRDITARKQAEDELQMQSSLQQVLLDVSANFISLPSEALEPLIQASLRDLGICLKADWGYIFDYDFHRGICISTHEWRADGISPRIDALKTVPLDLLPTWTETHCRGEIMYIPDVLDLPPNEIRDFLASRGVKTLIAVPLMNESECLGFVGFDSRHHRVYSNGERDLLTVFARLFVNVHLRRRAENELRVQSRLQQLLLDVSSAYIGLPAEEIDRAIQDSLGELASHIDADRGYVFEYDFDRGICTNTHEWCGEGIPPQIDALKAVPLESMTEWVETHRRGKAMYIPNVLSLPQGAVRDILEPQDIKNLLAVPLMSGRECIGFIGFDSVLRHHAYSDSEQYLLTVFGRLLVSVYLRRQAEESLKKSEEKHRLLIENSHDIIYALTPDGLFNFVSPAWIDLLGHPVDEVTGRHFREFVHPEDVPRCAAFLHSVIETEHRQEGVTYRVRHIDGTWRWHTSNGVALKDESGSVFGYQGIARDVTLQKEAEEAIRDAQQRLEDIIEFLPDATLVIDREGRVIAWNRAIEALTGVRKKDILGKGDHEYALSFYGERRPILVDLALHPRPEMEPSYAGIYRKEGVLFGESYTPNLPGGNLYLSGTASVLKDAKGDIVAAIECIRDNTQSKTMEANLLETNRHLEEATVRANDMAAQAEMASIAKSEFLANMSHEIRTPMNGVIGMTGLLLDTHLNEEQRRYADIVRISAESLLGLINDILDFSKIEAKKLDLEALDFDLSSLMEDFTAVLSMRAHEKGLELFCNIDSDVPTLLRGDPGRLRQVLTNLGANALKFTHRGEVSIRVSAADEKARTHDNDVLLRFSVRDTGIGIPEDKIGALFDKFVQVDASTTRKYGGTGLGLAIAKQLAELMGGRIGVESKKGHGSEFWFTARFGRQAEKIRRQSIPPADLNGVRALIVDDNATSREILDKHLTAWGMRPSEAKDGPEALRALNQAVDAQDPFRVVLIDMQMPGMDGAALGRAIQQDDRLAGARMVMLTSLGTRGDARKFEKIGFAAYAAKPVRHDELRTVLSLALRDRVDAGEAVQAIATRHTAREILNRFKDRKARILLAEDNITNQQVALGILKKLGLRADAVANGAEAVRAIETIPYDLVLMDVQMPEMDGLEATRIIRNSTPESGVHPVAGSRIPISRIPIIAMTAHAMQGDRERCLEAGMNDYISKPVAPLTLAEVLEKWLPQHNDPPGMIPYESVKKADASPSHSSPVFDRAGMMARLMDDEDLARTVIQGFIQDIPLQIKALRGYLDAGDGEKAQRQAHTIRGASANVGGEALRAAAFEMEKAARTGNLNAARAGVDDLEAQFERLKVAMEKQN